MVKFKLRFPDDDIFQDEDGNTEFSASRCDKIESVLSVYVSLERVRV